MKPSEAPDKPPISSVRPLPGTLDGAVDRLALCDVPAGATFEDEGAETITLHCVLAGAMRARLGDAPVIVATTGAALLLPPRTAISIAPCDPEGRRRPCNLRLLVASVSPLAAAALGLTEAPGSPKLQNIDAAPGASELLNTLLGEIDRPGLGTVMLASALMKLYLVQAARRRAAIEPPSETRIGRAITAVISDPGAPHSIEALAESVGMSRATFIRHFARAAGMNPMQFVAKVRLDHAAELLRTTTLPVKVIAAQVGFQNRSHFSRAFRSLHGADPSNFRALLESGGQVPAA